MIKYKKIQRQFQNTEVRTSRKEAVSTKDISLEIEREIGIPVIRCMSVLDAFVERVYKHLENGEPVTLEGLGTFSTKLMVEDGRVIAKKVRLVSPKQVRERLKKFRLVEDTDELTDESTMDK